MKKVDIKYTDVPNICFSLTKKEDDREEKFIEQRIERGFDDSETWSLCDTIANFTIPRLERYEEIAQDALLRDDELVNEINEFLVALKLVARNNGSWMWTEEEKKTS